MNTRPAGSAICTIGYFADPGVLRVLHLAPYAIEPPIVEADLLYPKVGEASDSIRLTAADLTRERGTLPLELDGPLLPGYAEEP